MGITNRLHWGDSVETFGAWLQEELKRRGMRQADLARESGLTEATISRLVNETRLVPDDETCIKIAKAFRNISVEEVFRRAGKLPLGGEDTEEERQKVLETGRLLNPEERRQWLEYADFLLQQRHKSKESSGTPGSPSAPPARSESA